MSKQHGQILPLFAIVLVAIIAMMALAIDVTSAYAARRAYRTSADAAALAGAQDLQAAGVRTVTAAQYTTARNRATALLADQYGAATCTLSGATSTCTFAGSPYTASIRTPLPAGSCVSCDTNRSVQVTVSNPDFSLSFARVFGVRSWNVSVTAVAGLVFHSSYALVTLRPPKPLPNGMDQNRQDIDVNGTNTVLNIVSGDVGTNTSAYTNSGARILLADGYYIHHIDDIVPDPWWKDLAGNPQGRLMTRVIDDPNYLDSSTPPNRDGMAVYPDTASAIDGLCTGVPAVITAMPGVICFKPGVYQDPLHTNSTDVAYLKPGMYFFDRGAEIQGEFYGGYVDGEGVSIWVPKSENFDTHAADRVSLNTATVTAPVDGAGVAQVNDEGLLLTLQVERDNSCFDGVTPKLCSDNSNTSLNIGGNAAFHIGGVIYGPSDKMQVNSSAHAGTVGQIYSWTISYSGGASLSQSYPAATGPALLRLDGACTAPSTPCIP